MAQNFPITNNTAYDFQSITAVVDGIQYQVSDISFSSTNDAGEFRGTGPNVLAYTEGTMSHEASMTMLVTDYHALLNALKDSDNQVGTAHFDILVTLKTRSSADIEEYALRDCRLGGDSQSFSSGPDPLTVDVTLYVRQIEHNGLVYYAD